MSGSLRRAFGLWIADQVDGLEVYADHVAASRRYPFATITELTQDTVWYGCGRRDFTVRDGTTGHVNASGKLAREETAYRVTVHVPPTTQGTGQEQVDAILDGLVRSIMTATLAWDPLVFEDTGVTPSVEFPVDRIRFEGRQSLGSSASRGDAAIDTSSEPFVFRGTITVRVARTVCFESEVEHVFESIHLEESTP